MKRAAIFVLLGPLLGACSVVFLHVWSGLKLSLIDIEGPVLALGCSFVVAATTAPVDWALSNFTPTTIRVPLTAFCGAVIAVGAMMSFGGKYTPPTEWLPQFRPIIIIAAICMGFCSFLSSEKQRAA